MKLGKTSIWMHLYEVSDKCYIDHSLFILPYINHKFISALKMFLLCLGVFMVLIFNITVALILKYSISALYFKHCKPDELFQFSQWLANIKQLSPSF